ncbi:MAG TPA: hypothetical protein VN773_10095 [Verrucomicrobiae bacterium]|nr:hypothetical protein [Verrucomicrobiae bacterium]
MVSALVAQSFDWLMPSPLWDFAAGDHRRPEFFQPILVELKTDDFMGEWFAASRAPGAEKLRAIALAPGLDGVTKLFLPVHGRYYLVAASLCCRIPGFPDRAIAAGDGDSVFFLLRRRIDGDELAWVEDGDERRWVTTGPAPRRVMTGEVRQPMASSEAGNGRSIAFGYVPVASGETWKVPAAELADAGDDPPDLRVEELGSRFTEPLTGPADPVTGVPDGANAAIKLARTDQARTISVYLLLEAWEYFERYLPDVAAAMAGDGTALSQPGAAAKEAILDHLASIVRPGSMNLRQALAHVGANAAALNAEGGVEGDQALVVLGFHSGYDLKANPIATTALLTLLDRVRAALPGEPPALELPKLSPRADAEYVIRAVYERADCTPPQQVVSLPSQVFRIAPFFDPDAPWRPVRIPLPADVSIAGMRKATKNVSFMLSEAMQRKMDSVTGQETALLKDSASISESPGIAFICSFSLQIVFIVAFMLLIIFVVVLNLVFWWMAFFKICLPIPKRLAP